MNRPHTGRYAQECDEAARFFARYRGTRVRDVKSGSEGVLKDVLGTLLYVVRPTGTYFWAHYADVVSAPEPTL